MEGRGGPIGEPYAPGAGTNGAGPPYRCWYAEATHTRNSSGETCGGGVWRISTAVGLARRTASDARAGHDSCNTRIKKLRITEYWTAERGVTSRDAT